MRAWVSASILNVVSSSSANLEVRLSLCGLLICEEDDLLRMEFCIWA